MVITDSELNFRSRETSGRFLTSLPRVRPTRALPNRVRDIELEVQCARARVRAHLLAGQIARELPG